MLPFVPFVMPLLPLVVPIRLCPPLVIVPARSGPSSPVLPATIVFVSVVVPPC